MKEKRILSFDVLTRGSSPSKNGILSVGFCLGDDKGNIIIRQRYDVSLMYFQETSDAIDKEDLLMFSRTSVGAEMASRCIRKYLDVYYRYYDLTIISDNPSYDIYFLNWYLNHFDLHSVLQDENGHFVGTVVCVDSYARGFGNLPLEDKYAYTSEDIKRIIRNVYGFNVTTKIRGKFVDENATHLYRFFIEMFMENNLIQKLEDFDINSPEMLD